MKRGVPVREAVYQLHINIYKYGHVLPSLSQSIISLSPTTTDSTFLREPSLSMRECRVRGGGVL